MNQTQPTQAAQTAQTNQLDMLKDIHTPAVIDQFQLAPGWWALIALLLLSLIYLINRLIKRKKAYRLLTPAKNELDQLAQKPANNESMAELSALLKRICLVYFPQHQVASLTGEQWVTFLNQQVGSELFSKDQKKAFSQLAYQLNQPIEQSLWLAIIDNSRFAIKMIIKQAARQTGRKQIKQKGSN